MPRKVLFLVLETHCNRMIKLEVKIAHNRKGVNLVLGPVYMEWGTPV